MIKMHLFFFLAKFCRRYRNLLLLTRFCNNFDLCCKQGIQMRGKMENGAVLQCFVLCLGIATDLRTILD